MTVRREVAKSAALSVLAIIVVSVGGFWAARAAATHEAEHQAEAATELLAASVISPALTDGLFTGDPQAISALDAAVQADVIGDRVLTVRVWSPAGTVLYSDDLAQIGQQFPLGAEEKEVLATGQPHAELSDLAKEENADQADFEQLLEVYTLARTRGGKPVLFETYQSTDGLAAGTRRILAGFAPVILTGLVVLGLIQLTLNWRLARNLERAQREREGLLQQALDASMHERSSIAADLHDGVVQELVGITFTLDGMAAGAQAATPAALTQAAVATRGSVRSLRSLLVDIYPPNLAQIGLAGAIEDLAAAARLGGVAVSVQVDPAIEMDQARVAAVYRTVREALSNIRRHSRASKVSISLAEQPGGSPGTGGNSSPVVLSVRDDGVGFDPASIPPGHLGLRLAQDLARSVGGTLQVSSHSGGGTEIRLELPR